MEGRCCNYLWSYYVLTLVHSTVVTCFISVSVCLFLKIKTIFYLLGILWLIMYKAKTQLTTSLKNKQKEVTIHIYIFQSVFLSPHITFTLNVVDAWAGKTTHNASKKQRFENCPQQRNIICRSEAVLIFFHCSLSETCVSSPGTYDIECVCIHTHAWIYNVCSPSWEVRNAVHHAYHWDLSGATTVIHASLPLAKKKRISLSTFYHFNIVMWKQGRKTVSEELCIDCQPLLQEMEMQFENKWCYQKC